MVSNTRIDPPIEVHWLKAPEVETFEDRLAVEQTVSAILDAVRRGGGDAVREYSTRLDRWSPDRFRVSGEQIKQAYQAVGKQGVSDIRFVYDQVRAFGDAQLKALRTVEIEPHPGVLIGHRLIPVDSVGCYVPGGLYSLIASVHMQVATAKVAGVRRVITCAPPRAGAIWPATLVAMDVCGADEVFALGGVQALAAMAYGTDEIAPVDMITGPGNVFVAEAKRQLFGVTGIDLPAGPTEILVIADETADADVVAADLLAQAEHGPTSPAHLVTNSAQLADAVCLAIESHIPKLPTRDIARTAWGARGAIALVKDRNDMVAYSDWLAPEHLEVMTSDPGWFLERLRNYGSIFLGEEATVAYSDKVIGTNHILPTGKASRYTGGLWVGKFVKVVTYQILTREGSNLIAPYASRIAAMEGMFGHCASCDVRLEKYGGKRSQSSAKSGLDPSHGPVI